VSSGIRFVTCVLRILREFVFSPLVLALILNFETVLICSFCVGVNYDVS
jgi:hypothetical protein